MTAPLVIEGAMNGEILLSYVSNAWLPRLNHGDIVVMDNLHPQGSTSSKRSRPLARKRYIYQYFTRSQSIRCPQQLKAYLPSSQHTAQPSPPIGLFSSLPTTNYPHQFKPYSDPRLLPDDGICKSEPSLGIPEWSNRRRDRGAARGMLQNCLHQGAPSPRFFRNAQTTEPLTPALDQAAAAVRRSTTESRRTAFWARRPRPSGRLYSGRG